MYNERKFKGHLKRLKIRKLLYMLIFSLLGSALGVVISDYIVDILLFNPILRVIIISITTLSFFWFSTLITATTEKDVQDGYWKMEVLNNLNNISQKLDNINIQVALPENNAIPAEIIAEEDNLMEVEILSKNSTQNTTKTDDVQDDEEAVKKAINETLDELTKVDETTFLNTKDSDATI